MTNRTPTLRIDEPRGVSDRLPELRSALEQQRQFRTDQLDELAAAAQPADLSARRVSVGEALRALTTFDVRWACDVLRPVYDATNGVDGRVSIEVDPRLAHNTRATIAEARTLWWAVDRPNMFVKIPAARQGLAAIAACLAEWISINVTLIFSLTRYDQVMDAYLDGMERARQGRPGSGPHRVGGVVLRLAGRL